MLIYGTDPTWSDTDGDGPTAWEELHRGSDPMDQLDTSVVPLGSLTVDFMGLPLTLAGWTAPRQRSFRGMRR